MEKVFKHRARDLAELSEKHTEEVEGGVIRNDRDFIILQEYLKGSTIKEVSEKYSISYWKAYDIIKQHGLTRKPRKPRTIPILYNQEKPFEKEIKVYLGEVYLRYIPVKINDSLAWMLFYAIGDGAATVDSLRIYGSPKKIPYHAVIDRIKAIPQELRPNKITVYFLKSANKDRISWEKTSEEEHEKWVIQLNNTLLVRAFKALRYGEFLSEMESAPAIAGIYDSDGYYNLERQEIIISQNILKSANLIMELLSTANIPYSVRSGGGRQKNGKQLHIAIKAKHIYPALERYSIRFQPISKNRQMKATLSPYFCIMLFYVSFSRTTYRQLIKYELLVI